MNDYIDAEIKLMRAYIKTWRSACESAAKKPDGVISKDEAKVLKKIQKATKRFDRDLKRLETPPTAGGK